MLGRKAKVMLLKSTTGRTDIWRMRHQTCRQVHGRWMPSSVLRRRKTNPTERYRVRRSLKATLKEVEEDMQIKS